MKLGLCARVMVALEECCLFRFERERDEKGVLQFEGPNADWFLPLRQWPDSLWSRAQLLDWNEGEECWTARDVDEDLVIAVCEVLCGSTTARCGFAVELLDTVLGDMGTGEGEHVILVTVVHALQGTIIDAARAVPIREERARLGRQLERLLGPLVENKAVLRERIMHVISRLTYLGGRSGDERDILAADLDETEEPAASPLPENVRFRSNTLFQEVRAPEHQPTVRETECGCEVTRPAGARLETDEDGSTVALANYAGCEQPLARFRRKGDAALFVAVLDQASAVWVPIVRKAAAR